MVEPPAAEGADASSSSELLAGRVAVIAGLGPGLGRAMSLALARHGADVAMVARRPERIAPVAQEVESLGRRALALEGDVTDASDCERIAQSVRDELGRVDVLVNNAFSEGAYTTFEEADLEEWRGPFEINFWGALRMTKAVLPHLKEHDESHVIMVNTMSTQQVEERFGAYAASKGALATATKTLARELGRYGVRVNGIHPGYIWGTSVEWYLNHLASERGTSFDEEYARVAEPSALGYIPTSEEIAGTVVFLASSLSRAVTGQAISVNGGTWMV